MIRMNEITEDKLRNNIAFSAFEDRVRNREPLKKR